MRSITTPDPTLPRRFFTPGGPFLAAATPSDRGLRRFAVLGSIALLVTSFGLIWGLAGISGGPIGPAPGPISPQGQNPPPQQQEDDVTAWQEVDRLISEDKYQAALDEVVRIRDRARAANNQKTVTRALMKEVQLRTGLHGYETAVRVLRSEEWPTSPPLNAALDLFYAQSLVNYVQAYSWEIRQRERIKSTEEVDLKAWTLDQLIGEANAAFYRVWQARDSWGTQDASASTVDIEEFLTENNYPERIRGTLRDRLTYLWTELLANSGFWTAQQSNEIFKLDLDRLLDRDGRALSDVELASDTEHPLLKLASILADLERWHGREGREEAAFEAQLERFRRVAANFNDSIASERKIRVALEQRVRNFDRDLPWWSMGMATLARQVQSSADVKEPLVAARDLALEGQRAHPESLGGQTCRSIVEGIEAPSANVAGMSSDGADRRSIEISHKNLERLYFRAYPIDLLQRIRSSRDYQLLADSQLVESMVRRRRASATWSVELPPTPDYEPHRTFVTPQLEQPGLYLIVASNDAGFQEASWKVGFNFLLSDLVMITRSVPDGRRPVNGNDFLLREITVRKGADGAPAAGAEVSLYRFDYQKGHTEVARKTTDRYGIATFEQPSDENAGYQFFALAQSGEHLALDANYYRFQRRTPLHTEVSSLLYTDRSIYRPNQTAHYKVVAYSGKRAEGDLAVLAKARVTVELIDGNGEVIETATHETNSFGSASGEFLLPSGRLLGAWSLRAIVTSHGGSYSYSQIRVEEYKRPTFEVTIHSPENELRLNRPAELEGSVQYYFGLPVVSGSVSYRVEREPVYPWWWYWYGRPTSGTQRVATGEASLDDEGRFQVSFIPEAEEPEGDARSVSYRYRLAVEVTDEGGETRSAERVFHLGFVTVSATIAAETSYVGTGERATLTIQRNDLDGNPRAGRGTWRLVVLDQPRRTLTPADQEVLSVPDGYRTEGDDLRPRQNPAYDPNQVLRSWPDGRELDRGTIVHGDDGSASVELDRLAAGAYRIYYSTTDPFGADFETQKELIVAREEKTPLALPAVLLAERPSVSVGGVARLLLHSGLEDQEMVLELYRDGERTELRRFDSDSGLQIVEIPITEQLRGGFGVTLTALRDHQLMRLSSQIFVPWDDRRLELSYETFRDRLRPGQTETWKVKVKSHDQQSLEQGAAELLAYMYDKSLDLFGPHTPPNALSLYPNRSGIGWLQSSLGAIYPVWWQGSFPYTASPPGLWNDRLEFLSGYGIGGPGRRDMRQAMRMKSAAAPAPESAMMMDSVAETSAEAREEGMALGKAENEAVTVTEADAPANVELRSDFSETAFWQPHLVVDQTGSASFEFTVPDSVTEWNVWLHALTRDLRSASRVDHTRTVKELMVRPYLPRFLREADRANITTVINNAGEDTLEGELFFDIIDPISEQSLLAEFGLDKRDARRSFRVEPGGGVDLGFEIQTPARVGSVAFRVVATAGDLSDGELRPLPILPGRFHLMQSRFVTLSDQDRREMRFDDLLRDDPTRINDQMVITLDAQLFYSVLSALPYLVDYPYECTEQTLNRFLSTGILSSMYERYPSVSAMARKLSERDTQFESFDEEDPNRKMLLEESPWLRQSRGGEDPGHDLIKVLDPEIAAAQRRSSLAKIEKSQTAIGGFPWWSGGPPSPYMTLYVLDGFSRALEFQVDLPRPQTDAMIRRAWGYMQRHYLDEMVERMVRNDCCWETVTYLNYVLSSYAKTEEGLDAWTGGVFSEQDRERMLAFSFEHWRAHSPRLKALLALTLERAGRSADATLVIDSIMDSAKTEQDLGTYWAQEDRSWLWYNDTIESHAFILRALTELHPDDERRHGLVQWLLLNKKLNHWKSTRATSEVIYSLVHYLEAEGTLEVREAAQVTVATKSYDFEWQPDEYTGKKNQIVLSGEDVGASTATVVVEKETPGLLFASATWHFSTETLPDEASSDFFGVERSFFVRVPVADGYELRPLEQGTRLAPGDVVEVHLSLRSKHQAEYVHLRDPRAAGFEPETLRSGYKWDLGIGWYEEVRDSGTNFFFEYLPVGEYTFKYRLRATTAGTFKVAPATVQSMYAPEFAAYSSGTRIQIAPQ